MAARVRRTAVFYLVTLVVAGVGIAALLHLGSRLPAPEFVSGAEPDQVAISGPAGLSAVDALVAGLARNFEEPLGRLFLQLLVIITVSRLLGAVFSRCGQPAVIGEMAAGIVLGPSLFGWLAPVGFHFVFPADAVGTLQLLSQVGVCLFMFAVGMELDVRHVRSRAHTAVLVSHASIVVPCFLGVGLACFLYSGLAQPGASFMAFALFMGISMSITAFPVLARILQERRLSQTPMGTMAITCAAVDDVTAWSLLAFVVAIARAGSVAASALSLLLVAGFIVVMIVGVRRVLPCLIGKAHLEGAEPSRGVLAAVVCVVVAAALSTEIIGIHALFGAFLAGAIMPEGGNFRQKLGVRIENFSSVLLLPLFFAYTGLRTRIDLIGDFQGWLLCLAIIGVATLGKLGGSAAAARFAGMGWRESLQLGALMNTRGLMELIALNIGYDLGILSPRIFTMLVVMALVTTVLTGPLLSLFGGGRRVREGALQPSAS